MVILLGVRNGFVKLYINNVIIVINKAAKCYEIKSTNQTPKHNWDKEEIPYSNLFQILETN